MDKNWARATKKVRERLIFPHSNPSKRAFIKRTVSAQLHFLGFVFGLVATVVLLIRVYPRHDQAHFLACLVYGVTGLIVFGVSAVYHFLHDGFRISEKLVDIFEELDHLAIYLFIAGTYTPVILNLVQPPWLKILLIGIWALGFAGILFSRFRPKLPAWAQHRFIYTGIFLLMGWTLLVRIGEIVTNLTTSGVFYLWAGAASYTLGAVIYATKRPVLLKGIFGYHELWHALVMFGYGFHYFLIFGLYA